MALSVVPLRTEEFIKEFVVTIPPLSLTDRGFKANPARVVVICIVRNDLDRMRIFLEHYRALGIKQFAILDDQSSDGTREFLLAQTDVEVFVSEQRYGLPRQFVWYDLLLHHYGYNRWYLIVDSDELFVYDDCEYRNIYQLIQFLEDRKLTAVQALMCDMYPCGKVFSETNNGLYANRIYFDKAGYVLSFIPDNCRILNIIGGLQARIFNGNPWLSKQPLFFATNISTIVNNHFMLPLSKKIFWGSSALLHYKFLPGDILRYAERVKEKNMWNFSYNERVYCDHLAKNISFYQDGISAKYENSRSLIEHGLMRRIWDSALAETAT